VCTREADDSGVAWSLRLRDFFDEPAAGTNEDELAGLRRALGKGGVCSCGQFISRVAECEEFNALWGEGSDMRPRPSFWCGRTHKLWWSSRRFHSSPVRSK